MVEPILDPNYWKERLEKAPEGNEHHAICICDVDLWKRIEEKHKEILAEKIKRNDSVLDVGCGMGRLLQLLPSCWEGDYLGIDVSPDFIKIAVETYPTETFIVCETSDIHGVPDKKFDWAILVSIRCMILRNLGEAYWLNCLTEIQRVAKKILYLEYDEFHPLDGESYEHLIKRSIQPSS